MTPSAYNKARLRAVYGMTDEELGLAEEVLPEHLKFGRDFQSLLESDATMRLMALVFTPHCNYKELQLVLVRTIEELSMNTGHDAALTRREALQRLAMLPLLLSMSGGRPRPMDDTLNQLAAGITSCEYLSRGNYEDMSLALSMLSSYLPVLKTIASESSTYRKQATELIAQSYLIKHVLVLHVGNPGEATRDGKLAVTYSKESGDVLLQVTALRRLTWSYLQDKQPRQALKTIEQAAYLINKSQVSLAPQVCSGIYSTLAVIQAKNGLSTTSALEQAQRFFFEPAAETDARIQGDFNYAQLMRNDGLARYHRGYYSDALKAFAQVIDPNTLSSKVAMAKRTRVELLHYQTMATMKSPERDLERAIVLWVAEVREAAALRSQKSFDEATMAYEVMQGVWPGEARVLDLRDLLVHW
jgi:tetratricopeptide (TPR) repeat protein